VATHEGHLDAAAILRTLAEYGVEFVVVGGVAVQAHGYLRATGDLDVMPRPQLLNLSRLAEALADLQAEAWRARRPIDVTDPQLLRRAPMLPLVTRFGRLDLLNIELTEGTPRSFDDLRRRALVIELGEVEVAVAGLDDLIRMKRAAGRDQDLADIGALTRTDEELEREAGEAT
jgi:predicted nucleotidyltransferase